MEQFLFKLPMLLALTHKLEHKKKRKPTTCVSEHWSSWSSTSMNPTNAGSCHGGFQSKREHSQLESQTTTVKNPGDVPISALSKKLPGLTGSSGANKTAKHRCIHYHWTK
jgi:hypothetical protein